MLQPTGHREWLDLDRWRSSKALTRPGYHEESRQTLPVNNNGKQTGFVAFLFELSHKGASVATFTIRYPTFCLILNRAENLWLTSPWFSAQQVRGTLTWFRSKCLEMGNCESRVRTRGIRFQRWRRRSGTRSRRAWAARFLGRYRLDGESLKQIKLYLSNFSSELTKAPNVILERGVVLSGQATTLTIRVRIRQHFVIKERIKRKGWPPFFIMWQRNIIRISFLVYTSLNIIKPLPRLLLK